MAKRGPKSRPELDRFWEKVNKDGPLHPVLGTKCWEWTSSYAGGYGQFGTSGERRSHRYAYAATYGPIPQKLYVLHKCDNMRCVRPNHLFVGTQKANLKDASLKGRTAERQGSSKLTTEAVLDIRTRYKRYSRKYGTGALARQYGVDKVTIWSALTGRAWRHVP